MKVFLLSTLVTSCLLAADYKGPRPEKQDLPYLLHATKLSPLDVADAKEEKRKDGFGASVSGTSAQARTPLAEPIFIMETKNIDAEKLELYRFDVKNGNREVFISSKPKKGAAFGRPLHLTVTRVAANLYRIEAAETLEPGEYSLSPSGSNQVFAFQVY